MLLVALPEELCLKELDLDGSKIDALDQEIGALAASVELYNHKNPEKKIPSLISLKYVANLVTRDSIENPQNATQDAQKSATEWEDLLKNDQSCQEKSLKNLKFLVEKISEHHSQKSI